MSGQQEFYLKDHGDKVLELVVNATNLPREHKATETLKLLCKRVRHVVLTLSPGASLAEEMEPVIEECGEFGILKVVMTDRGQIPFDLQSVKYFEHISDAKLRIKGEDALDKILDQMSSIPSLKSTTYKLIEKLQDPDVPFEEIETLAETDPNLVIRMLETANNAFNMRRNRIETLKMAVTYLGIEGIRQILAKEMFRGFVTFYSGQRDKLIHMRRCSHLADFLGKQIGLDQFMLSKVKIAALLHDIGSLGLSFYNKTDFVKVTNKVQHEGIDTSSAELHVFGIEHQEIGKLFAKEIGLPDYICNVIGSHHNTFGAEDNIMLTLIACANGFLNEKTEQIKFSEYDHLLATLVEKKIEHDKKENKNENEEVGEAEHSETNFTSVQFYGLLQEALDDLIASGDPA